MTDTDLAEAVAGLRETAAHLGERIEERAAEIAGPRIAAAEQYAARQIGQVEAAAIAAAARSDALVAELRRQLDVAHRQVAQLRWAARYLPWSVRNMVLVDPPAPGGWRGERPEGRWADGLDRVARSIGLDPYPTEPEERQDA